LKDNRLNKKQYKAEERYKDHSEEKIKGKEFRVFFSKI